MMSHCSRRGVLKSAVKLPFAAVVGLPIPTATSADTVDHKRAHLKLAINAYCFDPLLRDNLKDPATELLADLRTALDS